MITVSLIICSHNPRPDYLHRVLESLRAQTLPKDQWELIVIDNASQQPLVGEWDLSWHPSARHLFEGELGLSAARRRGMLEASADILLFVDDDNVLAADYLAEGLKIAREWPQLGTWGSAVITPEFEVQPPERLNPLLYLLAIREVETPRWTNIFQWEACPWGAGIFLRKCIADAYCEESRKASLQITDRRGASLMSGGDAELSFVACSLGMGIGIFPELRVTHLIPKGRIDHKYLTKLHEGVGISARLLMYKWKNVKPRSRSVVMRNLSLFKNFVVSRGLERELYFSNRRADRKVLDNINSIARNDDVTM